MRGLPFLILLFITYFGLPSAGLELSPFAAAAMALALYSGAYCAEIFRACWQTIPPGQVEAARAHGLAARQVFWHVQAPQALRASLPLLANQAVLLLKDCALASVITYPELAMTAGKVVSEQFIYLEPYLLLALCYWALAIAIDGLGRWLAKRFRLIPLLNPSSTRRRSADSAVALATAKPTK
jgi:ABC-type amino acid transport system permease subunit